MLEGFRVLDCSAEPGYLAGKILGDMGADVVKVEAPGGDGARRGPYLGDLEDPERSLLWLSLGLWLALSERWWSAGLAFAAAILSRQLTGVIAAAVGIGAAIGLRSLVPVVRVGLTSSLGVGFLSLWYWRWFDTIAPWGLRGGQAEAAVRGATSSGSFSGDVGGPYSLIENQLRGLVDLRFGVLVLTPMLLVALLGFRPGWSKAPSVARAAFVGGLVYYLTQHRIQIFAHFGYLGYRYPLEALAAMSPILFLSAREAWARFRLPALVGAGGSVAIHAVLAVLG